MCQITGMRTVSDDHKLQAQSLPEILHLWERITADLKPEVRAEANGALRKGNLLNAFVIWCCLQDRAKLLAIAKTGLRTLEHLKSLDESIDLMDISLEDFGGGMEIADKLHGEGSPTQRTRTAAGRNPDARTRKKRNSSAG